MVYVLQKNTSFHEFGVWRCTHDTPQNTITKYDVLHLKFAICRWKIMFSVIKFWRFASIIGLITSPWFVIATNVVQIVGVLSFKYSWFLCNNDDVIKWKHFPRNWPFVREIHRSPVNFPHKGQWRGALMFSLIYAWINDWVNNREAGDLRRQHGHYDVIVMNHRTDIILMTKDNNYVYYCNQSNYWSLAEMVTFLVSKYINIIFCSKYFVQVATINRMRFAVFGIFNPWLVSDRFDFLMFRIFYPL